MRRICMLPILVEAVEANRWPVLSRGDRLGKYLLPSNQTTKSPAGWTKISRGQRFSARVLDGKKKARCAQGRTGQTAMELIG